MRISKRSSKQLTLRSFPTFPWVFGGIFFLIGVASLFSGSGGIFFALIGLGVIASGTVTTYIFDKYKNQLIVQRWRFFKTHQVECSLESVVAVRLASKSVSAGGYSGTGYRIELVHDTNEITPLTNSYSSDEKQKKVAIAIGDFLNIEKEIPPSLGDVVRNIVGRFLGGS